MFNAHRDMYQTTSTRYEDRIRIHRPAHHPRLQEDIQRNDFPFQAVYPDASTVAKQSRSPTRVFCRRLVGPTPLHFTDWRVSTECSDGGSALGRTGAQFFHGFGSI